MITWKELWGQDFGERKGMTRALQGHCSRAGKVAIPGQNKAPRRRRFVSIAQNLIHIRKTPQVCEGVVVSPHDETVGGREQNKKDREEINIRYVWMRLYQLHLFFCTQGSLNNSEYGVSWVDPQQRELQGMQGTHSKLFLSVYYLNKSFSHTKWIKSEQNNICWLCFGQGNSFSVKYQQAKKKMETFSILNWNYNLHWVLWNLGNCDHLMNW